MNRAGIPLIELVFVPDLNDGEEAVAMVRELCRILEVLDVCSGKMEGNVPLSWVTETLIFFKIIST